MILDKLIYTDSSFQNRIQMGTKHKFSSDLCLFIWEENMYKLGKAILIIIWILDILNFPCMEFLDTRFPINGLAWFLIWCFLPSAD